MWLPSMDLSLYSCLYISQLWHKHLTNAREEARIFYLVRPAFSQRCGYMQYMLGVGYCTSHLVILLTKWYAGPTGLYIRSAPGNLDVHNQYVKTIYDIFVAIETKYEQFYPLW